MGKRGLRLPERRPLPRRDRRPAEGAVRGRRGVAKPGRDAARRVLSEFVAGSRWRSDCRNDPAVERPALFRGDTKTRCAVPFGRVAVSDLVRFERRNFWYSDGSSSHERRFRNRIELKVAINHAELSRDATLYWKADFEFFVPLSDDVPERYATKRRTRAGLGYRRDDRLRFEVLYVRDAARDTLDEEFDTVAANIVNFRLKVFF